MVDFIGECICWVILAILYPFTLMGKAKKAYKKNYADDGYGLEFNVIFFAVGGVFLLALYLAAIWFGWPYALAALLWVLEWTLARPLLWFFEGGPSNFVAAIVSTWQWLWSFELFRTIMHVGLGAVGVLIMYAVRKHRNYMRELRRKIELTEYNLNSTKDQYRSLAESHLNLISALEAVRRRALNQRERVRSQAAEFMRVEVEEILNRYRFNRLSQKAEELCTAWDEAFKVREEMIVRGRKGLEVTK